MSVGSETSKSSVNRPSEENECILLGAGSRHKGEGVLPILRGIQMRYLLFVAVQVCFVIGSLFAQAEEEVMSDSIYYRQEPLYNQNWKTAGMRYFRLPGISPDYELGPNDEIKVQVVGVPELDQNVRISNAGRINLGFCGVIQAGGMTAQQLESELAGRLLEQELLTNPEVLVFVEKYSSKPIYILGDVDNPGEYMMVQPWTLQDAIFVAGGLDLSADDYGFLHRRGPNFMVEKIVGVPDESALRAPDINVTKIDLRAAKLGGVVEPNPVLRAGDALFIPKKKLNFFYVAGAVASNGAFEMPDESTLTVKMALAKAGGPTKTAKISKGVLIRFDKIGERRELAVDFDAILQGRTPDFDVQPDDIIFIPGSVVKEVGIGILRMVPRIAAGMIFPF